MERHAFLFMKPRGLLSCGGGIWCLWTHLMPSLLARRSPASNFIPWSDNLDLLSVLCCLMLAPKSPFPKGKILKIAPEWYSTLPLARGHYSTTPTLSKGDYFPTCLPGKLPQYESLLLAKVPGKQTVPRAEAWAVSEVLQIYRGETPLKIITDASYVIKASTSTTGTSI